jgi:hypothetical protein
MTKERRWEDEASKDNISGHTSASSGFHAGRIDQAFLGKSGSVPFFRVPGDDTRTLAGVNG